MSERTSLLLLCCFASLFLLDHVNATRLKGAVRYSIYDGNFVLYLTRFGVMRGHDVYVFGTAERILDNPIIFNSRMTLVFIPQSTWDRFYPVSNVHPTPASCQSVMNTTLGSSIIVGENNCVSGFNDYLRKVPCDPHGDHYTYCNQPDSVNVTRGSSFTFHVRNAPSTEYYYLFVVSCSRNATETCEWGYSDDVHFGYDITLANSDPAGHRNYFDYHFSYEFHGILILEMTITIIYLVLVVTHFVLQSKLVAGKGYSTHHRLIHLFSASLMLELLHVSCVFVHFSVYAANGSGFVAMRYIGEIFNELSDWLLILVLILIAKGWQVTTCSIRWKKLTSVVWGVYIFISAVYFVWMVVSCHSNSGAHTHTHTLPLTVVCEESGDCTSGVGARPTLRVCLFVLLCVRVLLVYVCILKL